MLMKEAILCVSDSFTGDSRWRGKLVAVIMVSESVSYSREALYEDAVFFLRMSMLVPVEFQNELLFRLFLQIMNVA
jgi:hypothetical protein